MLLCIECIVQRLKKYFPVALVTSNEMARVIHNCFYLLFNLPIGLWVISGYHHVLYAEMRAQRCEELSREMYAIVFDIYVGVPCELIRS